MKKLLILLMVLGIVSAANALTYSASDFDTGNVTFKVVGGNRLIGYGDVLGVWEGQPQCGTSNISITLNGGDSGTAGLYNAAGNNGSVAGGVLHAEDIAASQQVQDAPWFEYAISGGNLNDTLVLTWWVNDEGWSSVGTQTITAVPEPMTIALLGLGGLFLRRRIA
jgi:hypothetical protein